MANSIAGNHLLDVMRAPTEHALTLLHEFETTGSISLPAVTVTGPATSQQSP
ncbi:hypothetical protein OG563_47005 [Nocardia vinacea]|uniref:Uncharacterized protein n=1 Tax=Nocardia vinacea TaxID=96468 RepID=A0ABZ1YXA0_9NOCA|nr:hypothetical protein [Nocardia vinacea]